jgi:hypothetical protein
MARKKRKRKRRPRPSPDQTAVPPAPSSVAVDDEKRAQAARTARGDPGGPPPAPWGSFPLSEIVVLVGIVLLFAGFFVEPPRGPIMIGTGLVLGSLAGLELSVREHFAGYRSHTLLIAGFPAVVVTAGLFALTKIPPLACLAAGVAAFALCAWQLAGLFRRRSGGALFKVKGS